MNEPTPASALFWEVAADLQHGDTRVVEGTIMGGRCLRVGAEFLALVDYNGAGLVVKLDRARVDALVASGIGRPFGPAGKVFREWVAIPQMERQRWLDLLKEGIAMAAARG